MTDYKIYEYQARPTVRLTIHASDWMQGADMRIEMAHDVVELYLPPDELGKIAATITPPAPDRGADDRSEPPAGYTVDGTSPFGAFADTPPGSAAHGEHETREGAVAACWTHRDSITAPAEARALALRKAAGVPIEHCHEQAVTHCEWLAVGWAQLELERAVTTRALAARDAAEARAATAEERAAHHVGGARVVAEQAEARAREAEQRLVDTVERLALERVREMESIVRAAMADRAAAREAGREEVAAMVRRWVKWQAESDCSPREALERLAAEVGPAPSHKSTEPDIEAARREVQRDRGPRCRETLGGDRCLRDADHEPACMFDLDEPTKAAPMGGTQDDEPCDFCGGDGDAPAHEKADDDDREPCEECGGSGVAPEPPAAPLLEPRRPVAYMSPEQLGTPYAPPAAPLGAPSARQAETLGIDPSNGAYGDTVVMECAGEPGCGQYEHAIAFLCTRCETHRYPTLAPRSHGLTPSAPQGGPDARAAGRALADAAEAYGDARDFKVTPAMTAAWERLTGAARAFAAATPPHGEPAPAAPSAPYQPRVGERVKVTVRGTVAGARASDIVTVVALDEGYTDDDSEPRLCVFTSEVRPTTDEPGGAS